MVDVDVDGRDCRVDSMLSGRWETKGATKNATSVTYDVRLSRVRSQTVVREFRQS